MKRSETRSGACRAVAMASSSASEMIGSMPLGQASQGERSQVCGKTHTIGGSIYIEHMFAMQNTETVIKLHTAMQNTHLVGAWRHDDKAAAAAPGSRLEIYRWDALRGAVVVPVAVCLG